MREGSRDEGGRHLRVGRADEYAVSPCGDETVDKEAEPRRVDSVVVRHQQHRCRRRRRGSSSGGGVHARLRAQHGAFPFVRRDVNEEFPLGKSRKTPPSPQRQKRTSRRPREQSPRSHMGNFFSAANMSLE